MYDLQACELAGGAQDKGKTFVDTPLASQIEAPDPDDTQRYLSILASWHISWEMGVEQQVRVDRMTDEASPPLAR